ncbi:hypothetical protein DEU56DRAFT_760181 [Suillus clintonianus]|uniref:uncharacterized protein n=1 Tax=Suillus clintonianus TaxID=1904413 RepID=UPI001B872C5D|nr:uncharacterized protein DEU56DRAFT_760181 [Suillus clintonianus]KAG2122901.1 hypothetical protein DEU56DRAFT_760181 [Suillus clintonianus]
MSISPLRMVDVPVATASSNGREGDKTRRISKPSEIFEDVSRIRLSSELRSSIVQMHSGRLAALPWTPGDVSENATEALQALDTYKKKDSSKVVVRFKAVGNAPIMRQDFYVPPTISRQSYSF